MSLGVSTPHVLVELQGLALPLDDAAEPRLPLRQAVAQRLQMPVGELGELVVIRRALDARRHRPQLVFAVQAALPKSLADRALARGAAAIVVAPRREMLRLRQPPDGPRPVVVGAGPAGLFAALTLAEAGWPPILIERGKIVEERSHDVSRLYRSGTLDPESNVCYGEGGAGTYSDGKLYTRVGDPRVLAFMEKLVALGADPDILVNTRPHLGTDRLIELLQASRARLTALGVTLRFGTRLEDVQVRDGAVAQVVLGEGERLDARALVLATGHSAREVWMKLHTTGFALEARPFAVGFRVEHPQGLIDRIQYGAHAGHAALPAADYRVTHNEPDGRGVYSFCMCPGGVVVTTPTRPGELCVNGMSHAARAGRFANSALVVSVGPADFGAEDLFAGVRFQERAEQAAYAAGGGAFVAPAQRLTDFLAAKAARALGASSYRRGLVPADLEALYPPVVSATLRRAVQRFGQKLRGFVTDEAQLIGVETRTASPVRVRRGDDLQALGVAGAYPAGEGMGYGGGIASAAVDGMRVAEAILLRAGAQRVAIA